MDTRKHYRHRKRGLKRGQLNNNKKHLADHMRDRPTGLERILYERIQLAIASSFQRLTLRKQEQRCGYILDAYIPELNIGFEADGPFHDREYDTHRDAVLRRNGGTRVIRFGANELTHHLGIVDRALSECLGL